MTEGRNSVSRDSRTTYVTWLLVAKRTIVQRIKKIEKTDVINYRPRRAQKETWPVAIISNEDTVNVKRITVHPALEDKPDKSMRKISKKRYYVR